MSNPVFDLGPNATDPPSNTEKLQLLNVLRSPSPYNAGNFSGANIDVDFTTNKFQKLNLTGSGTQTLVPAAGTEGGFGVIRIKNNTGSDISLDLDAGILKPSNSSMTFPANLVAGKTYITQFYNNGSNWEIISFVGGYS